MKKTKVEGDEIELYKKHGIEGFIVKGSYNCAHKVIIDGEQWVMRVGIVPYDKDGTPVLDGVLRGLHILDLLNKEKNLYGPSLLKELKHYVINPEDFTLKNDPKLCGIVKRNKYALTYKTKYAIQYVEYLRGSFLNWIIDEPRLVGALFSMIWFFRAAQRRLLFSHRDLKTDNILIRVYETPVVLTFVYNEKELFAWKTNHVPVIIDFDFGILLNATANSKIAEGTFYTVSPEATLLRFNPLEYKLMAADFLGYDYWSIGVVALETIYSWAKGDIFYLCADVLKRKYDNPYEEEYKIVYCMLMTHSVTNKKPNEFMPERFIEKYSMLFDVFNECINTLEYQLFKTLVNRISPALLSLLQQLLSWDANIRMQFPIFHDCFKDFDVTYNIKEHVDDNNTFKMNEKKMERMSKNEILRDYAYIEAQNGCLTCDKKGTHLQACVCCAALYCGKECQRQVH